jgi:branched-chain amino acid aminotransferase
MASQGKPKFAYFRGQIVPIEQAQVSVMTHALHYGTGAFGGLRAYWNADEDQLFLFRPHDHFERLLQSAHILRMALPLTPELLTQITCEVLRAEGFRENAYIRPLIYKSTETIGVKLNDIDDEFTLFAMPFGKYIENDGGAHVCFSAWRRVDDNAIPARGKITGSYANSALIKSDALLSGFDEALVLNQAGHVTEASAANIFIVRKGVVYTPPPSSDVLEGIVRRTLIQLLTEDLGVQVVERDIDHTEVYIADEIFLCGTGVQVAAVTRVEHRAIGTGAVGPVTAAVRDRFFEAVGGRIAKYRHWLTPVYVREPALG